MIDFNSLTRDDLLEVRINCDADLMYFIKFWFRVLKGSKFIENWHHVDMVGGFEACEKYELELFNINMPPRCSKTEMLINFIARSIGQNPTANFMYITASDELRSQVSTSIRDIVSHPYFYTMYGVEMKKDQNSKNLWRTTKGGGLKTATIFGQITGFGAGKMHEELLTDIREFDGCICLDDLNKTDDSVLDNAVAQKVVRTVANTVLSRKNSKDTPIINIQQRTGVSDVTAFFEKMYKENEKAKFLVYPAILENGELLWKNKIDHSFAEKMANDPETKHTWETQYMQNPKPREGILFHTDTLTFQDFNLIDFKSAIGSTAYIDVADSGSDNHCVLIGTVFDKKIYIKDVLFTKEGTTTNVELSAGVLNRNNPNYVYVESNFGGNMYSQLLRPLLNKTIQVIPVRQQANKIARINQMAGTIIKLCVFDSSNKSIDYKRFMENLTEYTIDGKVKHDDAPDCLEGLVSKLKQMHYSYFQ